MAGVKALNVALAVNASCTSDVRSNATTVYDMQDNGKRAWERNLGQVLYPTNSGIPAQDKPVQHFQRDFVMVLANRIAPEHLELAVADPESLLPRIRHAGAIFLGHHASESLGDYCAGPNHVLPTSRTARFSSPLGVYDFVKRSNVINVSAAGARKLAPIAATLARGERLEAHARSAELRAQGAREVNRR